MKHNFLAIMKISFALVLILSVSVLATYQVPVEKITVWGGGTSWHFNGYCEFEVTQSHGEDTITVDMVLDQSTSNLLIWKLTVGNIINNGQQYELFNEDDWHAGTQKVDFILQYSGTQESFPTGTCTSNLPSPSNQGTSTTTTTTTTPVTTTTTQPTTTTTQPTTTTTQPTTTTTQPTTTTTQPTTTTTQPKPTTTTTQPTTTTQLTTTTSQQSSTYYTVPVENDNTWGSGTTLYMQGSCTFDIQSQYGIGDIQIDMFLDQTVYVIQIWNAVNLGHSNDYDVYYLHNAHPISNQQLEIGFILRYEGSAASYPTGTCVSDLASSQDTTATTTPTTTTTTTTTATSTTTTPTPSATTTSPTTTPSSSQNVSTAHDYGRLIEYSILFYEAQQSGYLTFNRIDWRGDSATNDVGINGEDLTGGWYDAGDGVKFNLPMSASVTNLAMGLLHWKDAYEDSAQLQHMYNSIKWPLDYLLKCWRPSDRIYYAQVGDGDLDHAYWGRPEDMTMNRPAYYLDDTMSGADVTGGTASALAVGALVFSESDSQYAATLLSSAESLYSFAKDIPGLYNNDIHDITQFYESHEYKDEMCLSAVLLYMATNNPQYLTEAQAFYNDYNHDSVPWAFEWDDKTVLCEVLLYDITGDNIYKTRVENFVTAWMPSGSLPYTTCGLAWRLEWASLRYSANAAFIALLAADVGIGDATAYKTWAMSQIHYMVGDNGEDFSFLIGYGTDFPKRPHHRGSTCDYSPATCDWGTYSSSGPNAHTLYGALVGGPQDLDDTYSDDRNNHKTNEVACDYNAGFQSAVAGLLHFAVNGNLPASPTPSC
ncbi:E3.2.1.4 [Mytilus coruscus]|uniref:cellulase n=1 Tax=Mytilus coruscus TaxID=42192 RepID=A0A6J8EQW9_MYTCO|nr:E3.2.1.4 [Mytilus coruscus]